MIKRKKKICKGCRKEKFIYAKGYCSSCYAKENNRRQKASKKKAKLNVFSEKKKKENQEYRKLRLKFLDENPLCAVRLPDCTMVASEVHHKQGREGDLLTDVSKFLPICHNCHRWITDHSAQAIEQGWSLPRTTGTNRKIKFKNVKKYLLVVVADSKNDSPVKVTEIDEFFDFERFKRICGIIKENHNQWPTGDVSKKTIEEVYGDRIMEDEFNWFNNYIPSGEYGIHSIDSINLYEIVDHQKLL